MDPEPIPLVLISGPTGTGKSELSVEIALRIGGEIVNADSVQIYRGFDIGSAKPSIAQRSIVPHHLYDALDPDEHLDVARWVSLAEEVIEGIRSRGRVPLVVGGTNFYLRALLRGLPDLPPRQPDLRARLDAISNRPRGTHHLHRVLRRIDSVSADRIGRSDRHRIERALEVHAVTGQPISSFRAPSPDDPARFEYRQYALAIDRTILKRKLEDRVERMYREGLIAEVQSLLSRYPSTIHPLQSIGYKEAVAVLEDRLSSEAAVEETKRRTRAYARRQMTWLRAERDVQWLEATEAPEQLATRVVAKLIDPSPEPAPSPRNQS